MPRKSNDGSRLHAGNPQQLLLRQVPVIGPRGNYSHLGPVGKACRMRRLSSTRLNSGPQGCSAIIAARQQICALGMMA